ncbi:TRAP transporter small permease [Ruegeria sp. HKCCD8929]|uniref:TRAP transporter small permease n=1 Tax=Ruegeria sp. HKCCD8929 TaxID=2683006 RepID=UPI001489FDBE|nr:TRAP transporter small permease [Ruegeria sp. HKCCD8929]
MQLLNKLQIIAMCLTLWALFLIVGLQFFTRYVLNDSLGWTEEVARMFLIVLTYVGAVVCAQRDSHIKVDLILDMLPVRIKAVLVRSFDLIAAVFFLFLSWTAVRFANVTSLKMSSVPIPKSILFWICAVALLLMALHYLLHAIAKKDDHDENRNLGI